MDLLTDIDWKNLQRQIAERIRIVAGRQQHRLMMADTELCGGIAQRKPLAILLGGAVAVDRGRLVRRGRPRRCRIQQI